LSVPLLSVTLMHGVKTAKHATIIFSPPCGPVILQVVQKEVSHNTLTTTLVYFHNSFTDTQALSAVHV